MYSSRSRTVALMPPSYPAAAAASRTLAGRQQQPRRAERERLAVERRQRAEVLEPRPRAQGQQLPEQVDAVIGAAAVGAAVAQEGVVGAEDGADGVVLPGGEEVEVAELRPEA